MRIVSRNAAASIAATIAAVELLGDRTDLALDCAWGRMVARIDADLAAGMREGDAVGFTFDAAHAHLFELGECGARIVI